MSVFYCKILYHSMSPRQISPNGTIKYNVYCIIQQSLNFSIFQVCRLCQNHCCSGDWQLPTLTVYACCLMLYKRWLSVGKLNKPIHIEKRLCRLAVSALIKNIPCWEQRKVQTRPMKDSPLSISAENSNFPLRAWGIAAGPCPAAGPLEGQKMSPTVLVSNMVSEVTIRVACQSQQSEEFLQTNPSK